MEELISSLKNIINSAYIYLRIFDDRIEILNPGDLYGNNRLENLGSDNMLEVRNNTIIRLLEDTTDIVENRHTGIATMRDEMKKMNLPEPEFIEERGAFKVIFRNSKASTDQEIIYTNAQDGEQVSEQVNKTIAQYMDMLIDFCKEPKTAKEISVFLGISSRSYISRKIIKPLINKGILEYTNKKSANASNQRYITKQPQ